MIFRLFDSVDRAAGRDPDRAAFRAPGQAMTYAELADRSDRLAALLADQGVRKGDRVGIRMPRCIESAVAVYGVMKAGAAFVPIDPHTPVGGAAGLVEACGMRHLITHAMPPGPLGELVSRAGSIESVIGGGPGIGDGVRAVPWSAVDELEPRAPRAPVVDADMAYIMFSSGSTGSPKGIVHTHRSGLAYAAMSAETYGLRPDDRIGNHSPLHFDMSTLGYLTAPYVGATTVIVPEAHTKVVASLSTLIQDEGVTVWYSVPLALIQLLLRGALEARDMSRVRWVLFGGEPFPVKHLRALMERWPHARFSNVYGPAEVNQCTFYHVPRIDPDADDSIPVPVGRVWGIAEGLVVDEDDRVVAPGEPGELLIRSSTMMRGYWDRPDLDARAFFRVQGAGGHEEVFYRTGDLVRARADGEFVFLGRMDRQVKVRGYRVELDEVERALCQHGSVEEAAAYRVHAPGGDRIEAAVVANAGVGVDVDGLGATIADVLSWYAVPSRIEVVESFPRTATGKIDRRRLQLDAERRVAT